MIALEMAARLLQHDSAVRPLLPLIAAAAIAAPTTASRAGEDDKKQDDKAAAHKKRERARERQRRRAERERKLRAKILDARELEKGVAPWVPKINACYKKYGIVQKKASGGLRLELLIDKRGTVRRLDILAPGVKGKKLEACIKKFGYKLEFARKPGFTRAVIPFYFLKTKAPGAGPLRSCWSRSGCPARPREKRGKK